MQPPQNPYNPPPEGQPSYGQPQYVPQPAYVPQPQMPRGTVSLDVISEAWQFLSPNIGPWLLAMVAYFGVSYGINIIQNIFQALGQNGGSAIWIVLAILLQVIGWGVTQILAGGLAKLAIQTVRTRIANINEMWTVTNVWGRLLLSALLQTFICGLASLPGLIVLGIGVFGPLSQAGFFSPGAFAGGKFPNLPPSSIGAMVGGVSLGILLMFVVVVPLASLFLLTTSLIVDRKLGPWQAIAQSFGALKKHFWSTLLLAFVLGLINMGGVAACCIGLLFTVPLTVIAIALVYRDLFGIGEGAVAQQTVYAPPPIANPNF